MKRHYGDPFETGELASTAKSIRFKPNDNVLLSTVRTWLIFNNYSAALTGLVGKIYSDRGGSPGALIATSTTSYSKADIITLSSGVKGIPFAFTDVPLEQNTWYHFVLNASSYTYSDSAYIAWKKAWPDPVYRTGLSVTFENLLIFPYCFVAVGDEL